MKATVGGRPLDVPLYGDEDTTQRVVEHVNERLKQIEEASTRIDTQRFALLAAVSFAADLELARLEHAQDIRELLKALERIAHALRLLVSRVQQPSDR